MRVAFLTFVDAHDNCIHVQYTEKINCVETESYQIPGIMKAYMPEVLDYIVPVSLEMKPISTNLILILLKRAWMLGFLKRPLALCWFILGFLTHRYCNLAQVSRSTRKTLKDLDSTKGYKCNSVTIMSK